jgi:exosortase B
MSAVGASATPSRALTPWAWFLAGYAAMYLPVFWRASKDLWQTDELAHGPIVLGLVLFLFWRVRAPIAQAPMQRSTLLGLLLFVIGLVLYLLGGVFSVASATFLSQPFVAAAGITLLAGRRALKAAWFPLLYLLFMVPLPASLVELLTGPLKNWISVIVVESLYWLGLPIARSGVTITVGAYQLLVADACTGLNSMFSLAATGVLYMYLAGRESRLHNVVMIASIIPIAFAANIVRVVTLVLVTYFLGDEAGQGFLHGAAGMLLFAVALVLFGGLDTLLSALRRVRAPALR